MKIANPVHPIKAGFKLNALSLALSAMALALCLPKKTLAADPKCDATTGASHRIMGITTTTTSATVSWREGHNNGERWYCIGTETADKCAKAQTRAGGLKKEVFSGLTPNTKYKYQGYGIWGGKKSIVNGTFTTDGTGCWMDTTGDVRGIATTEAKTPLENVEVKVVHKSSNKVMGIDTTDQAGAFSIKVNDDATYVISFAYSPFTVPGSQSQWVQVQTVKNLSNLVFKGAYQVGGTILAKNGKDSAAGVTVKLTNKSDGALVATYVTNAKGHYNFGVKTGEYFVTPSFNGVTVAAVPVSVTKDAVIPPITLGITVSVQKNGLHKASIAPARKSVEYRANGARIQNSSTIKAGAFRKN